jgi:hypothetical protein
MNPEQNYGYLIVNVFTARGAIPLQDATVTIFDNEKYGKPIIVVLTTDSSGKTERYALPAPSRELSQQYYSRKPYATYMIQVELEGFYTVTNNNVPIFDGVTSIQPVEMVPLAEFNSDRIYPRVGLEIDENEPNL